MSLDSIIAGLAHIQRLQSSYDNDSVDRWNHIYTVNLLVAFSVFVTSKQFVGDPIECFCPDQSFDISKREYAKSYCWLKNTYRINANEPLPKNITDRSAAEINYYQWVHILLLVMAAMFKLPHLIWRLLGLSSGIDLYQVASMVASTHLQAHDKAVVIRHQVAEYFRHWILVNSEPIRTKWTRRRQTLSNVFSCCFFFWFRKQGNYLSGLYLLVKFLYLLNSVAIFTLLHHVVGDWFYLLGYKLFPNFTNETIHQTGQPPDLQFFPKVTFCDFDMWQQANIQTYTLQCTLPINMFNEKIFAFLWIWLWFLSVANAFSCLHQVYLLYLKRPDYRELQMLLKARGQLVTLQECEDFMEIHLRKDGLFVLDVIQKNSNTAVLGDFVLEYWTICKGPVYI